MLDERKSDIYKLVPDKYLPQTVVIKADDSNAEHVFETSGLQFPIIVKPDVGLKGFMVRKVDCVTELKDVLKEYEGREVLLQEFLTHESEYSLLYYRYPRTGGHGISSFIEKKLPFVIGDGKTTLAQLISDGINPFLQKEYILKKNISGKNRIVSKGEKVIIDHVGNYSRGSKFYSLNREIDDRLIASAHDFFSNLEGLYFGRIDLKADSVEDVRQGNFKILEINGAKAEPLHIYDPEVSFAQIWRSITSHWHIVRRIVSEQVESSFLFPSARDGINAAKALKRQVS